MCGVTEAALALSALSAAVGTASAYQQGQAQKRQAKVQSEIAQDNADLVAKQRALETNKAEKQKQQMQEQYGQMVGTGNVGLASSGVVTGGSGSASRWASDMKAGLQSDINQLNENTKNTLDALKVQEKSYSMTANMYSSAAQSAQTTGMLNAAGQLFSGAGSFAEKYQIYSDKKAAAKALEEQNTPKVE